MHHVFSQLKKQLERNGYSEKVIQETLKWYAQASNNDSLDFKTKKSIC